MTTDQPPSREEAISPRYTSAGHAATRTVTQRWMLKPYLNAQVTVDVHGRERLKSLQAPFIVTANHSSHLDAALVITSLPRRLGTQVSTGVAADTFYNQWWKAAPMTMFFNSFPIERPGRGKHRRKAKSSRRGMSGRLLSAGVPLLIFAEGTRSRTGAMGSFNPGIAALSISRGVPILPTAIVGAYAAWPSNAKKVAPGRPPVHVAFAAPMRPQPGEIANEFVTRVFTVIRQLHDSTARAYDMPTLDDYARAAALRELPPGPRKEGTTDA